MRFQGELIDLHPYSRENFNKEVLYWAWKAMDDAGDWHKLFWGFDSEECRGDLVEFCQFLHTDTDPKIIWFATDITTGKYVGLVILNKIKKHNAWGCIWVAPEFRKAGYAREMVSIVAANCFEQFGWTKIWAMTPWPIARNLLRKCGFKLISTIPAYPVYQSESDVYVMNLENPNG